MAGQPKKTNYTDVSDVAITDEKRERLFEAQTECALVWTNSAGWPVGVMHRYVWKDGCFWVSCAAQRKRVPALKKRPQSSVIVSSEGTWLGGDITTTAKTLATVYIDDPEMIAWAYPALAARLRRDDPDGQREFVRRMTHPNRAVIKLEPVEWITYDGTQLEAQLRGLEHSNNLAKRSRNLTTPPTGWELDYL
jgi:hypothetical protein